MDEDIVRIKLGHVERRESRTFLTLVTTEDVEIRFEVDDVATALLAITAGAMTKMLAATGGVPTVFADEG